MSIAVFLKNNLKNVPPRVGQAINLVPYSARPGIANVYKERQKQIRWLELLSVEGKRDFVFSRLKHLIDFAYNNIKFYRNYYDQSGFHPSSFKSFDDIHKIPITTKTLLNGYSLEERSYQKKGRYIVNTGGTSGTPFRLYIEPNSIGHEWAHMHTIWNKLGYKPSDLKIVFAGRSDVKNGIDYDVVRNQFAIDLYTDYERVLPKLLKIIKNYKIKYLHGYPSAIYDFAKYCEEDNPNLAVQLSRNLIGAFLGSEYPHKYYRKTIESVFNIKTVSWYGHTERAVLAYEKYEPYDYVPFLTYGYTETVLNSDGQYELISTSYYNESSPLIRYNTEDTVQNPKVEQGVLTSFKISNGRNGENVVDRTGKKINLTALIFGRHHQIFNHTEFIQVKQTSPGAIEIYYVGDISEAHAEKLFDANNLNLNIRFVKNEKPIRTISGKINLLIKC